MTPKKALIVEDDDILAMHARCALEEIDEMEFNVDSTGDGPEGLGLALAHAYDIAIIDRKLSGFDGLQIVRELRRLGRKTPVIVLTSLVDEKDLLEGYSSGIDDYVRKPCSMKELAARTMAVVKRFDASCRMPIQEVHDAVINRRTKTVTRRGVEIKLTPGQYKLFDFLCANRGRVMWFKEISLGVNGEESYERHTINEGARSLRNAMIMDGDEFPIENVRGKGYVIR